jgi:hypothetical protein
LTRLHNRGWRLSLCRGLCRRLGGLSAGYETSTAENNRDEEKGRAGNQERPRFEYAG